MVFKVLCGNADAHGKHFSVPYGAAYERLASLIVDRSRMCAASLFRTWARHSAIHSGQPGGHRPVRDLGIYPQGTSLSCFLILIW